LCAVVSCRTQKSREKIELLQSRRFWRAATAHVGSGTAQYAGGFEN
jgi:hypothetical protein